MEPTSPTTGVPVRHVLIVLACDDVARARDFYISVFGWEVVVDLPVYAELAVPTGLRVRYEFPAKGSRRAVTMFWHSGESRPQVAGVPDLSKWGGGTLFVLATLAPVRSEEVVGFRCAR